MTRGQVAKRLGKSLATVRRIEGVLLHSVQDSYGVHRFDDAQVEALAGRLEGGKITLWQALRGNADKGGSDLDFEQRDAAPVLSNMENQVQALRNELEELRRRHRREIVALQAEHERERIEHIAERREFETDVAEFMAALNELTD